MKTRAAILWGQGQDWSVEEIELDPPKTGEVLIKLVGSGLCHSDEHLRTGDLTVPADVAQALSIHQYPVIGGHEGAGEVVEVGPGVTSVKPGDHVALSFMPACGKCPSCNSGRTNLCDVGAFLGLGMQPTDFTARHHSGAGQDLQISCFLGTFGEYTVASEMSVIKIDDDIPLEKAAVVGCGVTTGWGSAVYAAGVKAGDTAVIVGTGGIGMNAVQGAAMMGAENVIAVETVDWKREKAREFGATHTAASIEEAVQLVGEITRGRLADKVVISVGVADADLIAPAMSMTAKGGRVVHTAVAPLAQTEVKLDLTELTFWQRELVGTVFGSANPRYDIPRLLALYKAGKLKLDELVTNEYKLDDINRGYDDMYNGTNIRGFLRY
ncbi:S-(hydroxymethyl)glutathione dehydrogenase/alcohol dehydrogenase [Antricoccus suffuscus]|uniref:S-(Hydroxymethyl)glutathione dehydrogenase/alcohol dehydrogenase n=1 Tax=Antricoccus suffuscus TaxID=1629062 RepID=A0A2T0ZTU0_9ACTN|nr:NDMA-dependent alcohol dehydrogenase [Antricoccus suffuscus]PRZ39714.1 S-(hydroxymethyl)glutathione dehydrogenase/alcohol dehydrogenase [Antricoccus suffuscus]